MHVTDNIQVLLSTSTTFIFVSFCLVPSQPRNIAVVGFTAFSINISWAKPEHDNGILLGYKVSVDKLGLKSRTVSE